MPKNMVSKNIVRPWFLLLLFLSASKTCIGASRMISAHVSDICMNDNEGHLRAWWSRRDVKDPLKDDIVPDERQPAAVLHSCRDEPVIDRGRTGQLLKPPPLPTNSTASWERERQRITKRINDWGQQKNMTLTAPRFTNDETSKHCQEELHKNRYGISVNQGNVLHIKMKVK